jgi:DNA-directed RNA polymerase subunit H (RpoH/RPB5)
MESVSAQDILIRSRMTTLDMLEERGYDTAPYRKITAGDLIKMIQTHITREESLKMTLTHKTNPEKKAIVLYSLNSIKQRVGSGDFVKKLLEPAESSGETAIDPTTTEVIVLYYMNDKVTTDKSDKIGFENTDSYDKAALEAWMNHQFKIQFFPMNRLVNNPMKHVLQPSFEIVPKDAEEGLMKEWYVRSKTQFPIIKFHNDPVARYLGLLPGQLVKITASSPTAGHYVKYRVCAP